MQWKPQSGGSWVDLNVITLFRKLLVVPDIESTRKLVRAGRDVLITELHVIYAHQWVLRARLVW